MFNSLSISPLLDLYGDSVLTGGNWLVRSLKLRLPKQENLAALSVKPGSPEMVGKLGFAAMGNAKLGVFAFTRCSTIGKCSLGGELGLEMDCHVGIGEGSE